MHRSQAGLMAILEAAVDGIVVINERGIIESVNPAVTKLFGYTPDRLLGQNVKMLMPDPYETAAAWPQARSNRSPAPAGS